MVHLIMQKLTKSILHPLTQQNRFNKLNSVISFATTLAFHDWTAWMMRVNHTAKVHK